MLVSFGKTETKTKTKTSGDCGVSGTVYPTSKTESPPSQVGLFVTWIQQHEAAYPGCLLNRTGQWMRVRCQLQGNHFIDGSGTKSKVLSTTCNREKRLWILQWYSRVSRQSVASWESGFWVSFRNCGIWESNPVTSESRHLLYTLFFFFFGGTIFENWET